MLRRATSFAGALASLCLMLAAASCSTAQPPVNRVQPNVVDKAVFDGEFYMLQTVIDAPYGVNFTFVGDQSSLQKIRWEIQENYLIARRSYQFIAGAETEAITGPAAETGAVLAMYAIDKHFDIRREYNPTTGEEQNVISENDADRPWYERQFMHVDWSKNLVTDTTFMIYARVFDAIRAEPVAYYVQDQNDPNRPRFERDATGSVQYIDIVNKMFAQPEEVYFPGEGSYPVCFLGYQSHIDCSPGEITVRNSFLKVQPNHDYQPVAYSGDRMERFGYFVTERPGYDPHYGVVEAARVRFANRHNLWAQSHRTNAGAPMTCATDADCDDGRGSVCDLDLARARRTMTGECTIPFRDRTTRKVVYYESTNLPDDLYVDLQHVTDQWNSAFVDTVASMREVECSAHAGTDCASERARTDASSLFVLCHNPSRASDDAACGPVGTEARIGDVRYSMVGWVNDGGLGTPLGYGPSAADPETGELIQGNAFIYGADLEILASYARDIVSVLNGDLDEATILSGANVDEWVHRQIAPGSEETGRTRDDHVVPLDGEDAASVNASMDFSWAHVSGPGRHARPSSPIALRTAVDSAGRRLQRAGRFGSGVGRGAARLESLRGTDLERMMTTADMRAAAGIDPHASVDANVLAAASPLRGRSSSELRVLAQARRLLNADTCVLGTDFADDGMLGLARALAKALSDGTCTIEFYGQAYPVCDDTGTHLDPEKVRTSLRHPIFEAVTAHEVGHTLGLRHNFSGSYDSLNYDAEYWRLRDDGTMLPRAWDPMTPAEIDGRIREFQFSTVMDYGHNFVVTDAAGIGHYDRAAIKMGYGDLVEVFSNAANPDEMAWIDFIQQAGWEVLLKESFFETGGDVAAYAYTDLPGVLGGVDRVQQRADVAYTSLVSSEYLAAQGIDDHLVDGTNRPIVPYRFCSDEQSDLGPDCMLYDAGADPYETLQSVIDNYWNYYIFHSFRRGRLGYDIGEYVDRIYWRYFDKLKGANQMYALNRAYLEDIFGSSPEMDHFYERPDGYGAWTLGVGATFQLFSRVVAAPEPGDYMNGTRADGSTALILDGPGSTAAVVHVPDGRYLDSSWNFADGYYWFDQLERSGYFYDKSLAIEALTDPATSFVGRDTSADLRSYELNYYSTFAPAMTGLVRGILSEDWASFAPRAGTRATGPRYPTAAELSDRTMTGVPLDPNASFSLQLYTAVFAMALVPETYDQSIVESARIFVRGGAEAVTLAPGTPTVEFTDPATGLIYVAASRPDAGGRELGIGALMLLHAQDLAAGGDPIAVTRFVDNINVMRSLAWQLGFGVAG